METIRQAVQMLCPSCCVIKSCNNFIANDFKICSSCKDFNQAYETKNYALHFYECKTCFTHKLPSNFLFVSGLIKIHKCKQCHYLEMITQMESFQKFITQLYNKLHHEILFHNTINEKKIIFDIKKEDIVSCYRKQMGNCFLTKQLMTHFYRYGIYIKMIYPNNIMVTLNDFNQGYVPQNIILVCSSQVKDIVQMSKQNPIIDANYQLIAKYLFNEDLFIKSLLNEEEMDRLGSNI